MGWQPHIPFDAYGRIAADDHSGQSPKSIQRSEDA
jgi:hypothetical protein